MQQLTINNSLVFTDRPIIALESTQSAEQDVGVLLKLADGVGQNGGNNACEKVLLTALNVAVEGSLSKQVEPIIVRLAVFYSARLRHALTFAQSNCDTYIKPWQPLLDALHYAMKLRVLRGYCNTHKDSPKLEAYMSQVPVWEEMLERLGSLENMLKSELNELEGESVSHVVNQNNQERLYQIGLIRLLLAYVCKMTDKEYLAEKHFAATRSIAETLDGHPEGLLERLPESPAWQCFVPGKLAHRLHNTSLVAFPF